MSIWFVSIAVLIVYTAVIFYLGWVTAKWLLSKHTFKMKVIYIFLLILLSNSFLLGALFDFDWLRVIGAYWMAILYILVFSVPIIHLGVYLFRFSNIPRVKVEKWAGLLTLIMVVFVMAYGSYNAYQPVVRTYDVVIENKDTDMKQLNIVMAADMHFGTLSNKNHAARLVEKINELEADVVLFPGDILDDEINEFVEQDMASVLANIQSTFGVYASLGNHDKGDIPELIEELEKSKMNILYDDTIMIHDSFTLIGRKDKTEQDRKSLEDLMKGIDSSKPTILLDHQPYELDVAQQNGVDLMVSGHTHRGQLAPFQYITNLIYENDWGYLQKEQLHSVVTSGFGFWGPPIRTGSQSEIVQIHVVFTAR